MAGRYGIDDLARGLTGLGLSVGGHVLMRASLTRVGAVDGNRAQAVIQATLDVIGETGTLAALAFRPMVPFPSRRPPTPPGPFSSGGLANALAAWPGAMLSEHPCCAWVAVGAGASRIIAGHDSQAACFHPVATLLDMDGTLVNLGNVLDSPGFSTVHHVQHELGLSSRNLLAGHIGLRTEAGIFISRDFPGCSMGFAKLYGAYVTAGILRAGQVGDAYAVAAKASDLVAVERPLIAAAPRLPLCDNPNCMHCRGLVTYNKRDWPAFWTKWVWRRLRRAL
ncbi:AAC(3) family N-acetyltransferase [Paramagnetospirillum kuznetsovii]|nr:AAC(3) family N-acetyltransferase [Paramagnetospirillum kuznetsovii]